jgi:hypothetical protein
MKGETNRRLPNGLIRFRSIPVYAKFFSDISVPGNIFCNAEFYRKLSVEKWMKQSVYMQGMIALFLNRTGDIRTSKDIPASLKENATSSAELGMY